MKQLRYDILKELVNAGCNSALATLSAIDIGERITDKKPITIYSELRLMLKDGLIAKGLQQGQAFTYYITKYGIEEKQKIES